MGVGGVWVVLGEIGVLLFVFGCEYVLYGLGLVVVV